MFFTELPIKSWLKKALKKNNFLQLTPIQEVSFKTLNFRPLNAIIFAPTGNPPTKDISTAADASPGRRKTNSVTGERIFPKAVEIPLFSIKQARNINGKSDGISTPPTVVSPFFIPADTTDDSVKRK